MPKRQIDLPDSVWRVVEAIADMNGVSISETIRDLVHGLTKGDFCTISIGDVGNNAEIIGMNGDKIAGNKTIDQSQGKINVGRDVNGNVTTTNTINCETVTLNLSERNHSAVLIDGKPFVINIDRQELKNERLLPEPIIDG